VLATPDVTAGAMAESIGRVVGGAGTQQVAVDPSDPAWSRAEVVSRPGEQAPSLVRVTPADPQALTVAALDAELGPPATFPPKVHFMDPVSRIYEIDTGEAGHTAAVIAESPPEGGDNVVAVVLRRDIRL